MAGPPGRAWSQAADSLVGPRKGFMSRFTDSASPLGADGMCPHRRRVLVVDDHRDSANAIVRLLQAEGYEAEAAYGYVETLARCKVGHFDVLVTDVRLPDGDGVQMLDAMRDRCDAPHAIAVSGCDEANEIARARVA